MNLISLLVASKRGHETKKRVLIGARHDVFCCQTLKFDSHFNGCFKKQTVTPKVSCLPVYVFDWCILLIFRFS